MPNHVALGIAVRHTKRSEQLFLWFSVRIQHGGIITMLSRMGQCSSYNDVSSYHVLDDLPQMHHVKR